MKRFLRLRGRLFWTVVAAACALIIGAVVPAMYENQTRQLSRDIDYRVTATSPESMVLDYQAFRAGKPNSQRAAGPECAPAKLANGQTQYPLACFIRDVPVDVDRHTQTGKADDSTLASSESEVTALIDGHLAARVSESSVLNRESTFPASGPSTALTMSLGEGGDEVTDPGFERDGLQYFFPADTEQRSYPLYDPLLHSSEPLDFSGTEKVDGIPTYTFQQDLHGRELDPEVEKLLFSAFAGTSADAEEATEVVGPAKNFYSQAEMERFDYQPEDTVVLEPYYSVSRTVWVESTTGTIVNAVTHVDISFATSPQEAAQLDATDPARERAVVNARLEWSPESQQRALDKVASTVNMTKAMSILGWGGKALGVVLLIIAARMYMRRRAGEAS